MDVWQLWKASCTPKVAGNLWAPGQAGSLRSTCLLLSLSVEKKKKGEWLLVNKLAECSLYVPPTILVSESLAPLIMCSKYPRGQKYGGILRSCREFTGSL